VHEAILRIEAAGEYARATDGTDLRAELWCNDHCDLLHVYGHDHEDLLSRVRSVAGVRESVARDGEVVAVTGDCLAEHERTVDPHLSRHDCLLVPPLVYADGAKRVRVLALAEESLSDAYRDLVDAFEVTVVAKRTVDAVTPPGALAETPSLSARQREALRIAHEEGYYELPRETDMESVADRMGIDRRTADEHRRRAERKVLDAVADRAFR
jgi:predicted DNA binding protein